jgi:hypothetical protein
MQPFFPMPPGYNPYNPFFNMGKSINSNLIVNFIWTFCLAAPTYPTAGTPRYPSQGKKFIRKKVILILLLLLLLLLGYGVDKPPPGGSNKKR